MTAPVNKGFAIHERIKRTSSLFLNGERNGMSEIKIAPRQKNHEDHAFSFCPLKNSDIHSSAKLMFNLAPADVRDLSCLR
jgi:hypothetical protein